MAVVSSGSTDASGIALTTAQTVDADSDSTIRRISSKALPAAIVVTTTVGGSPTTSFSIKGSLDGTNFYNIAYSLVATPETVAVAAITITTATTVTYLLRPNHAWKYIKTTMASTNNVTLTATLHL